MKVQFILLNKSSETLNRCLVALEHICKNSDWFEEFKQESLKLGYFPIKEYELSYFNDLYNEDLNWERIVVYAQEASYEYHNSNGINLVIKEDMNRYSRVENSTGISEDILERLNGLNSVSLSQELNSTIKHYYDFDGAELRIHTYIN